MLTSTGIGSGLDIESLVTQLVAAERTPTESRIQRQEATLASQLSSLGVFQGALASLRDSISGLNDESLFSAKSITSSDSASVSAQLTGDVEVASFDLEVLQLAQAHTLASGTFASRDEVVGEGTLTIRFGTTGYVGPDPGPESYNSFDENTDMGTFSLDLNSENNQLDQVRDQINELNAGVLASIVNDGQGYRLVLTSASTGEDASMEIVVSDTGDGDDGDNNGLSRLAFSSSSTNMEQTRQARNAEVLLNGLAISSSSNSLDEAIDGLSISLINTTESPVSISIAENRSSLTQQVSSFVTAYNTYIDTVNQVAGYNADLAEGGVLQGDFTVRSITNQLRGMISSAVPGSTGAYQYLSEVGIKTGDSGQLEFDTASFEAALDEDTESVAALFANRVEATDADIQTFGWNSADAEDGSWPVTITQMPSRAEYLGSAITFPLVIDENNDELSIALDGTSSGIINLTQGSYSSGEALASMLLAAIKSDSALSSANQIPDVSFNPDSNRLEIYSSDWGSQTSIEILSLDVNSAATLGLSLGEGTDGQDVAGLIGGWEAKGSGRVLSGASDTEVEGLSLEIEDGIIGDRGEISFNQGMAGLMGQLADRYLIDDGPLSQRSESINDRLDDLLEQREVLDMRMESVESRYRDQFNTLDSLLAQLQSTSTYLTQQLANLPGAISTSD